MSRNLIALKRASGEQFVFLYDEESVATLLETIDLYEQNPEIGLYTAEANALRDEAWRAFQIRLSQRAVLPAQRERN